MKGKFEKPPEVGKKEEIPKIELVTGNEWKRWELDLEEKQKEAKETKNWISYAEQAKDMKVLDPDFVPSGIKKDWPKMKSQLGKLREQRDWSHFLELAASIQILNPKEKIIKKDDWKYLEKHLESLSKRKIVGERHLIPASEMQILKPEEKLKRKARKITYGKWETFKEFELKVPREEENWAEFADRAMAFRILDSKEKLGLDKADWEDMENQLEKFKKQEENLPAAKLAAAMRILGSEVKISKKGLEVKPKGLEVKPKVETKEWEKLEEKGRLVTLDQWNSCEEDLERRRKRAEEEEDWIDFAEQAKDMEVLGLRGFRVPDIKEIWPKMKSQLDKLREEEDWDRFLKLAASMNKLLPKELYISRSDKKCIKEYLEYQREENWGKFLEVASAMKTLEIEPEEKIDKVTLEKLREEVDYQRRIPLDRDRFAYLAADLKKINPKEKLRLDEQAWREMKNKLDGYKRGEYYPGIARLAAAMATLEK